MRVNRKLLYSGVFLVALGGVLVIADQGLVDTAAIRDALRLWPLALIAIGLGLALRRTRLSLSSGMLAAALPGLVLGGAFAIAPRFGIDCGAPPADVRPVAQNPVGGTFDGSATVSIRSACGTVTIGTAAGNAWQLDAGRPSGRAPSVVSSPTSLSIDSGATNGWAFTNGAPNDWSLTLPTSPMGDLSLTIDAGRGTIALPGAHIDRLALTGNAAEVLVDASSASVGNVSGTMNLGLLSIRLPGTGNLSGSFRVNAGQLQVCMPAGLGLRVTSSGSLSQITIDGVKQPGSVWQSPDYASAPYRADLEIHVSLGAAEINPIGGCR